MQDSTALAVPAGIEQLWGLVQEYDQESRASSTRAGYATDWRIFTDWAQTHDYEVTLPVAPGYVKAFLAEQSLTVCTGTLGRRLSSIRYVHDQAGMVSPTAHPEVRKTLGGIARRRQDTIKQARPVYLDELAAMVEGLDDSPKAARDRCALLVGWWGAFRRSELVGLRWSDVGDHPQGVTAKLHKSKTDQTGKGRTVPLHYHAEAVCPVRALRQWRTIANGAADGGRILRRVDRWGHVHREPLSGAAISTIVREAADRVGLDPQGFSGHSLRAGFVSECDRRGIGSTAVMLVTGHKNPAMLSVYTRPRSLFDQSAGALFDDVERPGP